MSVSLLERFEGSEGGNHLAKNKVNLRHSLASSQTSVLASSRECLSHGVSCLTMSNGHEVERDASME